MFGSRPQRREEWLEFENQSIRVLRRRGQRSLRIHVKSGGQILVTAGFAMPPRAILNFVAQAWSWVEKSKERILIHEKSFPPFEFRQEDEIFYLGQPKRLKYVQGLRKKVQVYLGGGHLVIEVPPLHWRGFRPEDPHPEFRELIRRFYRAKAEPFILSRFEHWTTRMELWPKQIQFRCQKSRWGSCSSSGTISINWKLMAAPLEVLDYVIVHELAHLKIPNHSKRFWQLVRDFDAAHVEHSRWLRANQQKLNFLRGD